MTSLVRLDPGTGFAFIGPERVAIADAGRNGALQVGGAAGPILRPPRFGERSRVVWRAAESADPHTAIARGMLHVALERGGEGETVVFEIIALALAGADQDGAAFEETALAVARVTGMDIAALDAIDAVEVDRLARHIAPDRTGEWSTFVLETEGPELSTIRERLVDRLLRRGKPATAGENQATTGVDPGGVAAAPVAHARGPIDETPTHGVLHVAGGPVASPLSRPASRQGATLEPANATESSRRSRIPESRRGLSRTSDVAASAASASAGFDPEHTVDPPQVAERQDPGPAHSVRLSRVAGRQDRGRAAGVSSAASLDQPARPADLRWRLIAPGRDGRIASDPSMIASPPDATITIAAQVREMTVPGSPAANASGSLAHMPSSGGSPFVRSDAPLTATRVDTASGAFADRRPDDRYAPVDVDAVAEELARRLSDEAALRGVFQ